MFNWIDNLLNRITMYRLVLYYLIFLVVAAFALSLAGVLPYNPFTLAASTLFLVALAWLFNGIFSWLFNVPANAESYYITALILALIITPGFSDFNAYFWFLIWAVIWSMASKYILTIKKKHIFNPAAFAVALTAFTIGQSATWWVGTKWMLPFVLIGGFLVARKIRRFDMVISFLVVAAGTTTIFHLASGIPVSSLLKSIALNSPLFFFAFIMLTEPLTTPPTRNLRIYYGALTGFLFSPAIRIGSIYSTPELALLVGNIFSYLVSPKQKLILKLKSKLHVGRDIYDFLFKPDQKLAFQPGQYLEWTLGHENSDSRGNRRYFTIASAPTENEIRMGVKFYENSSSFKMSLLNADEKTKIVAGQLAGDFVMPKNPGQKLVFMAGGIGITPFRSMIKYLLDRQEKRDIVILYSNKNSSEVVYKDVFDKAEEKLGIKTFYALTGADSLPEGWRGETGRISAKTITEEVPDYQERIFYLSGPRAMVVAFEKTLKEMGVKKSRIKTDFFPGFA